MDLRTGKLYSSVEEARTDGVPESDIVHIKAQIDSNNRLQELLPEIDFADFEEKNRKKMMKEMRRDWRKLELK